MAERLFFALRPDSSTAQRIEALARDLRHTHGLRGKSLGPQRFHVTLHLIGDFEAGVPAEVVGRAMAAARPVAADALPFHIGFDTVASFTRKRRNTPVVLLGDEGLREVQLFQQALMAALVRVGLTMQPQARFTPHLTLLYDDAKLMPQAVEPLIWRATELLLVRSLLGRGRHEIVARAAFSNGLAISDRARKSPAP